MTLMLMLMFFIMPIYTGAEDTADTLVVGVPADRCPIFYIDPKTEEIVGIGADLIRAVAQESGYEASIEVISEKTNKDALDNPRYDVIMPFGSAIKSTSGQDTIVTKNIIQTPFTLVTIHNEELPALNDLRIGMLSSLAGGAETVKLLYPGIQIILYNTMPECVTALRKGEVDALLHNSYVWSYVLQKPAYSDLKVQPTTMFSMDFRAGTLNTSKGQEIIEKLNAGIEKVPDTKKQAIILNYTSKHLYQNDFWDNVYEYKTFLIVSIVVFILLIVIFIYKQQALRKQHELSMRKLKESDSLTGILNSEGFNNTVKRLLTSHPNNKYYLIFSNIRNFKIINENMGRETGNEFLCFWAKHIVNNLSDEEVAGRIAGDRFAVLRKITDNKQAQQDEKLFVDPARSYFTEKNQEFKLQICSGIYTLMPDDYKNINVDRMLDCARIAENRAREIYKTNYEFYNPEQWEKEKQIADISGHLQAALRNREIQVWYQPQIDYITGEITGAEALCRWNHATRGWLHPEMFIPILEETGAILELDKYVWNKVCQDLHRWNLEGKHHCVSINLSRADIRSDMNVVDIFNELMSKYNLDPKQLHIEITETAYTEKQDTLIKSTAALREHGFQVEMDDFGSGYSSLNMLKEVSVDRIKMDMHFLTDTGDAKKSQIIITHMIKMIEELDMQLIAEGVETKEQAEFLKEKGCREMQGYYFYKPMPAEDFENI